MLPRRGGLRALTNIVEAPRGQALWHVCRVEERGQEGHGHVLLVVQGGFILRTLPWEQEELQVFKETSGVKRTPSSFSTEDTSAHACRLPVAGPSPRVCNLDRGLSGL